MQRASKIPLGIPSGYQVLNKTPKPHNSLPVPKPCDLPPLFFFFVLPLRGWSLFFSAVALLHYSRAPMPIPSHAWHRQRKCGEHHRPGWFTSLWPQPSQMVGSRVCPTEPRHELGAEQAPGCIPGLVLARDPAPCSFVAQLLRGELGEILASQGCRCNTRPTRCAGFSPGCHGGRPATLQRSQAGCTRERFGLLWLSKNHLSGNLGSQDGSWQVRSSFPWSAAKAVRTH